MRLTNALEVIPNKTFKHLGTKETELVAGD